MYWEYVLVEAEYNNITYIALSFSIITGEQMKAGPIEEYKRRVKGADEQE